jgi:hypothetical protein
VTETSHPAGTGLDNWELAIRGSKSWCGNLRADPSEMWPLQVASGDPTLAQLNRAKQDTEQLRKKGKCAHFVGVGVWFSMSRSLLSLLKSVSFGLVVRQIVVS